MAVAVFYKGAGVGTYWHTKDAVHHGFTAQQPGKAGGADVIIEHIVLGNTDSPYISLTRSYGVARDYALAAGRRKPTAKHPAYVYRILIPEDVRVTLFDPLQEVAKQLPLPIQSPSYQHEGTQDFLLGVVDPSTFSAQLTAPILSPPGLSSTARQSNLSKELEMFVRALRDAEILAQGTVPQSCVTTRYDVY